MAAQREALGQVCLTHQEVVEKLDKVPMFYIVAVDHNEALVQTDDGPDGQACGCWYFDRADATRQLERLQKANGEGAPRLALETVPLGTAFALTENWRPLPEGTRVRLEASRAVLASLPERPEPLPPIPAAPAQAA